MTIPTKSPSIYSTHTLSLTHTHSLSLSGAGTYARKHTHVVREARYPSSVDVERHMRGRARQHPQTHRPRSDAICSKFGSSRRCTMSCRISLKRPTSFRRASTSRDAN